MFCGRRNSLRDGSKREFSERQDERRWCIGHPYSVERDCWASQGGKWSVLENEYVEYFKAREKRAEERARNEVRAEFAIRINIAVGKLRKELSENKVSNSLLHPHD